MSDLRVASPLSAPGRAFTPKPIVRSLAQTDRGLSRVARFASSERGSLVVFSLFCFLCMLILAGVALDVMHTEERRTRLQNTLDRAVLAAADLNQTLAPKDVVKDYFTKSGLRALVVRQHRRFRLRAERHPLRREVDPPRGALEQPRVKLRLQARHRLRHARRSHPQPVGRAAEPAGLGHGKEDRDRVELLHG